MLRAVFARPTLIIIGANDMMTPPRAGRQLAELIAGAETVTIADGGHTLMAEAPDAVLDALIGFLRHAERPEPWRLKPPAARQRSRGGGSRTRGRGSRRLHERPTHDLAAIRDQAVEGVLGRIELPTGGSVARRHRLDLPQSGLNNGGDRRPVPRCGRP